VQLIIKFSLFHIRIFFISLSHVLISVACISLFITLLSGLKENGLSYRRETFRIDQH